MFTALLWVGYFATSTAWHRMLFTRRQCNVQAPDVYQCLACTVGWLTQHSKRPFPLSSFTMEAIKKQHFVPVSFAASGGSFQVWPVRCDGKCTGKLLGKPVLPGKGTDNIGTFPFFHPEHEHATWAVPVPLLPQSDSMRISSKNGEDGVVEMSPRMHRQVSKPMPETTFP